jgi:hypothetical protein
MAMPTGSVLVPPCNVGVSRPMSGTISMHMAIPIAPPIKRNFLPNRSRSQHHWLVLPLPRRVRLYITSREQRYDKMRLTNCPGCIKCKDNTTCCVQSIDEVDCVCGCENLLVDCRGIRVQRALSWELLSNIDYEGQKESFPDGGILDSFSLGSRQN